jgi:hypothetical protein
MPVRRATQQSRPQRNAPRSKLSYGVTSFAGVNTTDDPLEIADMESPDTLNTIYDTVRSVGSRKGYTKVLTTPTPAANSGLREYYQSNGTKQLVYGSGQFLYRYDNAGGSVQLTGAQASFTTGTQWSFDVYNDQLYAGNGVDPLQVYNGTSYNNDTAASFTVNAANVAVTPQFVKFHKNRLYCANKNSSILYFADAGNPNSFPVNNFIQVNTNDGQNITGIEILLDSLIVFKDNSIFILTGEPLGAGNTTTIGNLQLRKANSDVGCVAFRTIQRVGSQLMFAHSSGIYAFQNYATQLISQRVNLTFKNDMNPGFLSSMWGLYSSVEKKYLLGYASSVSTTPDKVIVFDLLQKEYTIWDHFPASCAVNYRFSGQFDSVVFGDPNKGNIYQALQGYADIAGDNGIASSGSTTTLVDTSKSWTTNQFVDCRVLIVSGAGAGQTAVVASNTSTTLTLTTTLGTAPTTGSVYTIGYYTSYWKSKIFDFGLNEWTKKYKYFNIFADSATYNLQVGFSLSFQALAFQQTTSLNTSNAVWGQANTYWGSPAIAWGTKVSVQKRVNISGQGRTIQAIFGNNLANQPWRVIRYSFTYKLKKERGDVA